MPRVEHASLFTENRIGRMLHNTRGNVAFCVPLKVGTGSWSRMMKRLYAQVRTVVQECFFPPYEGVSYLLSSTGRTKNWKGRSPERVWGGLQTKSTSFVCLNFNL